MDVVVEFGSSRGRVSTLLGRADLLSDEGNIRLLGITANDDVPRTRRLDKWQPGTGIQSLPPIDPFPERVKLPPTAKKGRAPFVVGLLWRSDVRNASFRMVAARSCPTDDDLWD